MEGNNSTTTVLTPDTNKSISFEFYGNASDYFKIWIVNMLLTIVTIGLYSPWAKVRNNQYLYANSYLGRHSFEYTANPVRILIGRLIVVGFYAAFIVTGDLLGMYEVALVIMVIFSLMIPWLIRQSMAFRRRYVRFQGINFKLHATTGQFYLFFIKHFFFNLFTLGLAYPYTHNKFQELVIGNTHYGKSEFDYYAKTGDFYLTHLLKVPIVTGIFSFILIIIGSILYAILAKIGFDISPNFTMIDDNLEIDQGGAFFSFIVAATYIYLIILSLLSKGLVDGWIGNIVYNNTNLADYKMQNRWKPLKLSWIYITNFFIVLFTAGLMHPWAKVRALRYKLENMGFEDFDFYKFTSDKTEDVGALGEESADFFDFDIGL